MQAVLPEQKCVQTRKGPQKILVVLSRDLTLYGPISARQNRVCPCQAMVMKEKTAINSRIEKALPERRLLWKGAHKSTPNKKKVNA